MLVLVWVQLASSGGEDVLSFPLSAAGPNRR